MVQCRPRGSKRASQGSVRCEAAVGIKVSTLGQPAFIRRKGAMTKALRARSFAITLIFALSISAVACGGRYQRPVVSCVRHVERASRVHIYASDHFSAP